MCRCPPCWGWACSSATCTCSSLQDCKYHFANKKRFLEDQIAHQFQEYRSHTGCHVPQQVSVAQHVGGRLLRQCPERWLLLEEQTEKVTYFFWWDQSSFRMGQSFDVFQVFCHDLSFTSTVVTARPCIATTGARQALTLQQKDYSLIETLWGLLSCLTREVLNRYASLAFVPKFDFCQAPTYPHAHKLHDSRHLRCSSH